MTHLLLRNFAIYSEKFLPGRGSSVLQHPSFVAWDRRSRDVEPSANEQIWTREFCVNDAVSHYTKSWAVRNRLRQLILGFSNDTKNRGANVMEWWSFGAMLVIKVFTSSAKLPDPERGNSEGDKLSLRNASAVLRESGSCQSPRSREIWW
jgi:hypothetical protein